MVIFSSLFYCACEMFDFCYWNKIRFWTTTQYFVCSLLGAPSQTTSEIFPLYRWTLRTLHTFDTHTLQTSLQYHLFESFPFCDHPQMRPCLSEANGLNQRTHLFQFVASLMSWSLLSSAIAVTYVEWFLQKYFAMLPKNIPSYQPLK